MTALALSAIDANVAFEITCMLSCKSRSVLPCQAGAPARNNISGDPPFFGCPAPPAGADVRHLRCRIARTSNERLPGLPRTSPDTISD
jgi:hypothetical protein